MDSKKLFFYQSKVAKSFTPSSPIDRASLFAGRKAQLAKLASAVTQKGQHAILYGQRGVGKTSLANVLKDLLIENNKDDKDNYCLVGLTTCSSTSSLKSIWKSLFSDIIVPRGVPSLGFLSENSQKLETLADQHLLNFEADVSAEDTRRALEKIPCHSVFIIDEFDRVAPNVRREVADMIKVLSDRAINTTVVLIGVADAVTGLISDHISIERALVQIEMPRMSEMELGEIIEKGVAATEMFIEKGAQERIVQLSQGFPHYTHMLSLYSAQTALESGRFNIQMEDVDKAISLSVENSQQSMLNAYLAATASRKGGLYGQVITACAYSQKDEMSYFSSSDVSDPLSAITKKEYHVVAFQQHLSEFCSDKRGNILERRGVPKKYRYRFSNPLMEPYVILQGLKHTWSIKPSKEDSAKLA